MCAVLSLPCVGLGQAGVDILGSPIPGITAIGHHAIGVNMSLLAVDRPFSERQWRTDAETDSLSRRARRAMRKAESPSFHEWI